MNPEEKSKRRRLVFNRLLGIIIAFSMVVLLLFYYFNMIDSWLLTINIVVLAGVLFAINAGVIETKQTSGWTKVNVFASTMMFLLGGGLLAYGLISKNLILF